MTWEHGDCLSMTPIYRIFDLVINKGYLDCVMCSSDLIKRRMNMYRDEVERVLGLGDLEDEDGDRNNNEVGQGKGITTTMPSTAKNATRKDKKKSATTTAEKKNNKKKNPPPLLLGDSIGPPPQPSLVMI